MSTYDLIYKLVTHYYLYNNAFAEVFCIRRFFNSDELLGDRNGAIMPTLSVAYAQNEGLKTISETI